MKYLMRIVFFYHRDFGLFAPYLTVVNCTGSPPSIDKIKICDFSSTYRIKASCFPSGLHAGFVAPSWEVVNCDGAKVFDVEALYIWVRYV
jgi:hypothetical protein